MGLLFFQQQFSDSLVPAGYPTIQTYSDTNFPELASDSIGLRAQSYKTTLTSDSNSNSWVPTFVHLQ